MKRKGKETKIENEVTSVNYYGITNRRNAVGKIVEPNIKPWLSTL